MQVDFTCAEFHAMYGIQCNSTQCTEFRAIPRYVRNSEQFHAMYGIQSNSTQFTEFRAIPRNVRNSEQFHAMYGIHSYSTQCTELREIPRNVRNSEQFHVMYGITLESPISEVYLFCSRGINTEARQCILLPIAKIFRWKAKRKAHNFENILH